MNIYESITAVQSDVEFIGKEKQVKEGGNYKYRGVDQVLNTLHPLFAKHKVFAVPEVLEVLLREERTTNKGNKVLYQVLKVKYTFYAEDGSNISAIVVGEAMDSGDKASNKCMSVAYKYACFQILSIPTEETSADPDDDAQPLKPKSSSIQNENPLTVNELRDVYRITDMKGAIGWIREKTGKSLSELTVQECEAIRARFAKEKQKREERAEEHRKALDEAEGEVPF